MTSRKILTYLLLGISVLVLLRLFMPREESSEQSEADVAPEQRDYPTPDLPLSYSIGTVDSRFGISRERLLELAEEARKLWEEAAGKQLIRWEEDGTLKVNLVFDWRQEKLLAAKEGKAALDQNGQSFDLLQSEYDRKSKALDDARTRLEAAARSFQTRLSDYNARVARWNDGIDRTESDTRTLQSRKTELEKEQAELEKGRDELNNRGVELNGLGESLNEQVLKHNLEVENFNGRYVRSRDFEKGVFDGSSINIYEIEKEEDLKLTLVHEFGHALGLGHADDPSSIMHRKLAVQDLTNIRFSEEDIRLLRSRIK